MTAITKWLFQTKSTTAPSIDFIINFRTLDSDWTRNRRHRLKGLISSFAGILFFDLSFNFNVEMRVVLIVEGNSGILGFDDPAFGLDMLYFFKEESTPAQQHHLILFTTNNYSLTLSNSSDVNLINTNKTP